MRLKALMTSPVEVISPHASVASAERRLRVKGIHHLVVVDHDAIVGLLSNDILRDRQADGAKKVEDAMLRNITLATPEMTVQDAVDLVKPGHLQTALPVISGDRLVGIVTVSDLLDLAGRARGDHKPSSVPG
jgi:acetoin utilization protein AcuB